jgi:hypothetical protein
MDCQTRNTAVSSRSSDLEADLALIANESSVADDERAEQIIAAWMEYLPTACVRTMIKLGWHRSV